MPVIVCTLDGRPGFKWGGRGKCYTYVPEDERSKKAARSKAAAQGLAIKLSQGRTDAVDVAALEQLRRKRGELGLARRGRRRPPAWLYPSAVETKYRGILRRLVNQWATQISERLIPHLESLVQEADLEQPRQDASPANAKRLLDALDVSMTRTLEGVDFEATDIGQRTSDWNDAQWQKTMRSVVGVEVFQREPWLAAELEAFTIQNVDIITKLQADTVAEVRRVVQIGLREGRRVETIRKQLMSTSLQPLGPGGADQASVLRKIRNRSKLIARDQVGKLNGDLQHLRQTNLGISQYIWRTVGDERVRDSHRAMDGRRCRWDDPTVYFNAASGTWLKRSGIGGVPLHPGQDVQCRCSAEPVLDELEAEVGRAPVEPVSGAAPRVAPVRRQRARAVAKRKPTRVPLTKVPPSGAPVPIEDVFYGSRVQITTKQGVPQFYKAPQQQAAAKAIYAQKTESVYVWGKNGQLLGSNTDGKKALVNMPRSAMKSGKLKGSLEMHNHPSSSAFSSADIWGGLRREAGGSVVVSEKAMYRMTFLKPDEGKLQYMKVKQAYSRQNTAARKAGVARIRAGADFEEVLAEHWHEVNTRVVKQFPTLLKYERTLIK